MRKNLESSSTREKAETRIRVLHTWAFGIEHVPLQSIQGDAVTNRSAYVGRNEMAEKVRLRSDKSSRPASLHREYAVYETSLSQWLTDHEGKYVLIKGDQIGGFYGSRDEALAEGYSRFGIGPLLVKQITSSEPVHHIPNALI